MAATTQYRYIVCPFCMNIMRILTNISICSYIYPFIIVLLKELLVINPFFFLHFFPTQLQSVPGNDSVSKEVLIACKCVFGE